MGKDPRDGYSLVIKLLTGFTDQLLSTHRPLYGDSYERPVVLVSGTGSLGTYKVSSSSLKNEDYIVLGANPLDAVEAGCFPKNYSTPSYNNGLGDPLQLAAMFAVIGNKPTEAKKLLKYRSMVCDERRHVIASPEERKTMQHSVFPYNWMPLNTVAMQSPTFVKTWVPVFNPENYGLDRVEFCKGLDSAFLYTWFNGANLAKYAKTDKGGYSTTTTLHASVAINQAFNGLLTNEVEEVAHHCLQEVLRVMDRRRFDYEAVMNILKHCSKDVAERTYASFKDSKRLVYLARPDVSEHHYLLGLRTLPSATDSSRITALSLMGRSPTLDELKSIRGNGGFTVLYYLPQPYLQALLDKHGVGPLRAFLLPYVDNVNPALLREALNDHKERAVLVDAAPMHITNTSTVLDWKSVFSELYSKYEKSVYLRHRLIELAGNEKIAFLFALNAASPSDSLKEILEQHPNYTEIEALKEHYDFTPRLGGYT